MLKSVLEFIITFAENHFETCIINCRNHSASITSSTSINGETTTTTLVLQFIERLVELTCSTVDPLLLSRIIIVWNKLMSILSLKTFITSPPSLPSSSSSSQLCLKLSMHVLSACLLRTNRDYMFDSMNELINDLQCALYVDAFVMHILAPVIATSKAGTLSIDKVCMCVYASLCCVIQLNCVNLSVYSISFYPSQCHYHHHHHHSSSS